MTVPAFVASLADFGERVALVDDSGERVTYAELDRRVETLAAGLGDERRLVMVEVASTIPSVVAYLAALRGGHAVIAGKAGDADPSASIFSTFQPSAYHRAGSEGFAVVGPADVALAPDLAVLLSTSGSTGSAKLVRLSAGNVDANARSIAEYLEIDEHEVAPIVLPLSYSYGASILTSHLCRGATLVLTEHSVVDPEFAALFDREGCTSLSGVPYTWELIEQVGFLEGGRPSLKTLTQAGGKMPASRVLRLAGWARENDARLFVMYGATECTARMSYLPWEFVFDAPDSVGVAIPGGRFELICEDGSVVDGEGEAGELVYTGPNVMMGYAEAREDLAGPAESDRRHTGDVATRDGDGLYRIVGRLSRFSKILGLRISLDEVERLARDGGFEEVVATGDDDLIALAIPDGSADTEALETRVANQCNIPRDTVVALALADGIPRLHNGKVDYRSITQQARKIAEARQAETGSLREELAGLLGLEALADGDSFASLGGDSLTYIQASFAIEKRLGTLPPDWEKLSIGALEAYERGEGSAVARAEEDAGRAMIDVDVLLRAVAITAVVWNHTRPPGFEPIPGAMATLLLAVGQNLARFRSDSLFAGEGLDLVKSTLTRYMLPYWLILVTYLLAKQEFDIPSLLFVSTFFTNRASSFLEPFWFIEVFFQIALLLAMVFAIPPLRNGIAGRPLAFGVGAFGLLGASHVVANAWGVSLPPVALWSGIVALGWSVHFAQERTERILLSLTALGMPWLTPRGEMVALVMLILLWVQRVPLFVEPIKNAFGKIGAASFQIYILHAVVITALGFLPGMRGSVLYPLLSIPASIAAGVAWSLWPLLRQRLRGRGEGAFTTEPDAAI